MMNGNEANATKKQLDKMRFIYPILTYLVALKISKEKLSRISGIPLETVRKGIRNPSHVSIETLETMLYALEEYNHVQCEELFNI